MNLKKAGQLWKKGIGIGLSISMFMSVAPAEAVSAAEYPASVPVLSEKVKSIPEARKAGSIPASEDTLTYEQPFAPFTAGNENFRIPTLISLRNSGEEGEHLFASADARWEEWNDGGGIDSIASVSSDGGQTWNYSFPIYFPDSYGYASRAATTVIDPGAIEGPDGTIYFIADVNPTGSTTMYGTVGQGTGYVTVNGKRRLALTDDYTKVKTRPTDTNLTDYPYYVDDFNEEGYAEILNRSDGASTGFGVDEWYNIYSMEDGAYKDNLTQPQVNRAEVEVQQNCFYKDSKFHVYHIDYIWVVQSKDGGRTWEHPRDITDQIKREDEYAILVSPGKGIVTKDGEIAIGLYSAQNGEHASMIYTKDGETWERTADIADGSSEDEIVELEDGTLRMFYRGGGNEIRYVDFTKNEQGGYDVGTYVGTGVSVKSSINVSAVLYSEKINGKQAILVARSGGGGGLTSDSRLNGKIFTFLVDDEQDGNPMELYHTFEVPGGKDGFVYSCMTEMKDGRIAMLWEPNHSTLYFDIYDFNELTADCEDVELKIGEEPYTTIYIEEPKDSDCGDETVIQMEKEIKEGGFLRDHITNREADLSSFSTHLNEEIQIQDAEFTFQQTNTAGSWNIYNESTGLYIQNSDANDMFTTDEYSMTVTEVSADDGTKTFKIKNGSRPVFFFEKNMDFNSQGSSAGDAENLVLFEKKDSQGENDLIPGYARASEIKAGGKYLITYIWKDGSIIVLYPANGSTEAHTKLAAVDPSILIITGIKAGSTVAVVDGKTYKIAVTDPREFIALEKGDTYVIPTESTEAVLDGGDALEIEKIDRIREGLFDHVADAAFSLEGFSKEANEEIGLSDAEFTFQASGDNWIVSHGDLYLSNPERANAFFSETSAAIKATAGNGNTFRLSRGEALKDTSNGSINTDKTGQPIGNLVFYYREMNFRSYGTETKEGTTHGASPYGQHGTYNLTLLEKQDGESESDIIPGYQAVSAITSGKQYLISYIWNDSVFVLYPENGMANSTKLVNPAEKGFRITAKAAGEASFVIDDITYHFTVTDTEVENAKKDLEALLDQMKTEYESNAADLSTWKVFQEAYAAAQAYIANTETVELGKLQELFKNLKESQMQLAAEKDLKNKQEKPEAVKKGDSQVVDGVSYIVTDTVKKTAAVTGGSAATMTIRAAVTFGKDTYTVTAIQDKAFASSSALKKITIGDSVESIGAQAFAGCKTLKTVVIGKDVKTIGKKAFYNCKKLSKVTVKNNSKLSKVGGSAFKKTAKNIKIKLPKNLKKNKKVKKQLKKAGLKKGL